MKRKKPLYWQFNRAKSKAKVAVRDGDWKLVASLAEPGPNLGADITAEEIHQIKTVGLGNFELYNLKEDIAESNDLANSHSDVLESLKQQMETTYKQVQAEAPEWPEWKWPRYESSKIQWPDYWLNRKRPPAKK